MKTIVPQDAPPADAGTDDQTLQLGRWYWVSGDDRDDPSPWLGCVIGIGSNYVELEEPPRERSSRSTRIHFSEFDKRLTPAPDAEQHIRDMQARYRAELAALLGQVRDVTARLAIVPSKAVTDQSAPGQNALVVVTGTADPNAYKRALIKAKEETLPQLFKQIEEANEELARWMAAPTLPLQAAIGPMKENIGAINDRIYTIELYAGLTEEAVQCCDGPPAAMDEKLRVMQRRLYMDEECLANYSAGGMEFKDVEQFDKWISRPVNRDRIMPFPRTLVALRVRRKTKDREHGGNLLEVFINIRLEDADKKTFLYVRNGAQVWRIDCDFVFDEMILPNRQQFDPSVPMMVRRLGGDIEDIIPRSQWEGMRESELEEKRKARAWKKAHPKAHAFDNPHDRGFGHSSRDYFPLDQSNVYFDDAMGTIADEIKRYNRIAVIVQGLFDRSMALHPHPPVRMWDAASFNRSVELIYDGASLTHGDKPDFEAYRAQLNASIGPGSIVTGQGDFWQRAMAVIENRRQANDWRNSRRMMADYTRFAPSGDPGPDDVGPMADWRPRARQAVFRWRRANRRTYWRDDGAVAASIAVPAAELLNVSAYKRGDFKLFFSDPRTRKDYLQWAPLLLAAEDYIAGKTKRPR